MNTPNEPTAEARRIVHVCKQRWSHSGVPFDGLEDDIATALAERDALRKEQTDILTQALQDYEAQVLKLEGYLERANWRRCDIPACNCGGYHNWNPHSWEGSIIDRLNEFARENAKDFCEVNDGAEAADLIVQIHGAYNNLSSVRADRDTLRAEVERLRGLVREARRFAEILAKGARNSWVRTLHDDGVALRLTGAYSDDLQLKAGDMRAAHEWLTRPDVVAEVILNSDKRKEPNREN